VRVIANGRTTTIDVDHNVEKKKNILKLFHAMALPVQFDPRPPLFGA